MLYRNGGPAHSQRISRHLSQCQRREKGGMGNQKRANCSKPCGVGGNEARQCELRQEGNRAYVQGATLVSYSERPRKVQRGHIYQARQLPHHTQGPGFSSQYRRKGREKGGEKWIWREGERRRRNEREEGHSKFSPL